MNYECLSYFTFDSRGASEISWYPTLTSKLDTKCQSSVYVYSCLLAACQIPRHLVRAHSMYARLRQHFTSLPPIKHRNISIKLFTVQCSLPAVFTCACNGQNSATWTALGQKCNHDQLQPSTLTPDNGSGKVHVAAITTIICVWEPYRCATLDILACTGVMRY